MNSNIIRQGLGTVPGPLKLLRRAAFASSTALTGIDAAAHTLTRPGTDDHQVVTPRLSHANRSQIAFALGHLSAAAAKTCTVRVFGVKPLLAGWARTPSGPSDNAGSDYTEYLTPCLLDLTLTAGSNAVPAASKIIERTPGVIENICWVDGAGFGAVTDYTRGNSAVVKYEGANGFAVLDFDREGFEQLIIRMKIGTCAGIFPLHGDL